MSNLYRFTFDAGNYDIRQVVVRALSPEGAYAKLVNACERRAFTEQGACVARDGWRVEDVIIEDQNDMKWTCTEIEGDVVFTYGVDG